MDRGRHIKCFHFCKTLDIVSHNITKELEKLGPGETTKTWEGQLVRYAEEGSWSKRKAASSSISAQMYLELILLTIFINGLEDSVGHMVVTFSCDTAN